MNIQLQNLNFNSMKYFQSEKIVSVRILERKESSALVDINGYKTEASVSQDVPDNFLAFVEVSKDGNYRSVFRLRVLSSFINSADFKEINKRKFLDNIEAFFIGHNIPLSEDLIKSALKLHSQGIKLDSFYIRLLSQASAKYGEDLSGILLQFIKKGMVIDLDFIDFFRHLDKIQLKLICLRQTKKLISFPVRQKKDLMILIC